MDGARKSTTPRTHFFHQSQRGESLSGAARHDRQCTVVVLQFRLDRVDGLALVVTWFEHPARVRRVAGERAPVDVRAADPVQVDACDVAVLVVCDEFLKIMAHRGRGVSNDEMLVPGVGHRRHKKRGHVLIRQRIRITFRLDSPVLAVHVLRDQVDAGILPARVCGRVVPHPHMVEPVSPCGVLGEEPLHGTLPFRTLLAIVHRLFNDAVEYLIDADAHSRPSEDALERFTSSTLPGRYTGSRCKHAPSSVNLRDLHIPRQRRHQE